MLGRQFLPDLWFINHLLAPTSFGRVTTLPLDAKHGLYRRNRRESTTRLLYFFQVQIRAVPFLVSR